MRTIRHIEHGRLRGWVLEMPNPVHLADRDDTSAVYTGSYNQACTWCYLGVAHSEYAHAAKVIAYQRLALHGA